MIEARPSMAATIGGNAGGFGKETRQHPGRAPERA